MKKTAQIIYLCLGTIFPILIGSLHSWVHFRELIRPEIRAELVGPVVIMGKEQALWNSWGLMSFMMGFSFIIIGLLQLEIQRKLSWKNYPSIPGCSLIILYLLGVIYASASFDALPQLYGGIGGMILALLCLGISIKAKEQENKSQNYETKRRN